MENGRRVRKDENNFKEITKNIITEIVCLGSKIKFKVLYLIGRNEIANGMCNAIRNLINENEKQRGMLKHIEELCECNLYGNPEMRLRKIKEEIAQTFPND